MDIYILTDYLHRFESKVPAVPYRSGFDKEKLKAEFIKLDYNPIFLNFSSIDFSSIDFCDKFVIYTSSEDGGLFYKGFIEDILWGIKLQGGKLLPDLVYQRAHHNKVFMEVLRDVAKIDRNLQTRYFGSLKEIKDNIGVINFPAVIKSSGGSGSKGVKLVKNRDQLFKAAKKLTNSCSWYGQILEYGLLLKRYVQKMGFFDKETIFRKKIVIQDFIQGLNHDWKVLIYGNKYYVLQRLNRKNDFRASGSGVLFPIDDKRFYMPEGLLDFACDIYKKLKTPNLSLDIAYDSKDFYLIEFQGIYFGTYTQTISKKYFEKQGNNWIKVNNDLELETVYTQSINEYINNNYKSVLCSQKDKD